MHTKISSALILYPLKMLPCTRISGYVPTLIQVQTCNDYSGHSYLMQKCIVLEYALQINCNKKKIRVKRVERTFMTWFYNILRIIIHLNHILKWEVLTNQVNWLLSYLVFRRIYIIFIVSAIYAWLIIKYDFQFIPFCKLSY